MYCSVLQCIAVYCSILQCITVCCSVLQCAAVCCNVLQCAAVCCSVSQFIVVFHVAEKVDEALLYSVLQYIAVYVLQCVAVH